MLQKTGNMICNFKNVLGEDPRTTFSHMCFKKYTCTNFQILQSLESQGDILLHK